jgi:hypothetical protein
MPFLQPDYTPYARFQDIVFDNVHHSAFAFF